MTTNKIPAPANLVLIADDLTEVLDDWTDELTSYGVPCLRVSTLGGLDRAYELYRNEIKAVILDGCIPGHEVNTIEFILRVRSEGFTRPIIAASSSVYYRMLMVRAGCSHEAPKHYAAELVADLLSRP